jgi:hypothetical protein
MEAFHTRAKIIEAVMPAKTGQFSTAAWLAVHFDFASCPD